MARKKKREGTGGGKRWNDNGKRMSRQWKFGNWVLSSKMKNFEYKLASDLISKFFWDVTRAWKRSPEDPKIICRKHEMARNIKRGRAETGTRRKLMRVARIKEWVTSARG